MTKLGLSFGFAVFLPVFIWVLLVPYPVSSQVVLPLLLDDSRESSAQYEDTLRELVERYEDLRERLREEIRRNEDRYSRAEMDAAVAELENELSHAYRRIERLEAQLKESLLRHREAEAKSLRYKATLLKTENGLLRELDTERRIAEAMDVEKIFQVGPTFSPAGTLGVLGAINLPGTPMGLLAGTDYDLREQAWTSRFGVTFSFLSQRSIVDTWIRLQNRERTKDMLTTEELRAIRSRRRR